MKDFLYFLSIILLVTWMIAFLFYDAPNIIHVLVIVVLIILITRLIIKDKNDKSGRR